MTATGFLMRQTGIDQPYETSLDKLSFRHRSCLLMLAEG